MGRRLSASDFISATELLRGPNSSTYGYTDYFAYWPVCEKYELRGDEIVAKWPFEESYSDRWMLYRPLDHTPNLFLRFARLNENLDFPRAALDFCHEYGAPGDCALPLGYIQEMGFDDSYSFDEHMDRVFGGYERHAARTSLGEFQIEVDEMSEILTVYEKFLNRDFEELQLTHDDMYLHDASGDSAKRPFRTLVSCATHVQSRVDTLCRQNVFFTEEFRSPETALSGMRSAWEFDTLFGAAYLQIFWLLTSGGNVTRCEQCRRVISLARPRPDGRKTRRDKRFCHDSCRQAHHRSRKKS